MGSVYRPTIFQLNNPDDVIAYNDLITFQKGIIIVDKIEAMIGEWVKNAHPRMNFTETELKYKISERIGSESRDEYGVWVYYEWLNRLVHLLPENEFIELRTSRNKYKILPQEQALLHTKKIGVVGLSVGQSVAVTLALERCFGTIRLADFDTLDLSNMNRIRSGVHEIGELKVVNTAREILEIDPFLDVEIYPTGLNIDNMDEFFLKNGQLDLIIDECDSLDIKLLLREQAKRLKIPVLMDTSDKGMLDVERFDIEPTRPILHGYVGDLKAAELNSLTTEEKIPFILKIVGVETMSERMKVSMLEIGQSIKTWPQLASNVVLGGGATGDVARRLLLDYGVKSGRYFVDLDTIIPDDQSKVKEQKKHKEKTRSIESLLNKLKKINLQPSNLSVNIDKTVLKDLVGQASQAPSGGNMQAWYWYYSNKQLFLILDDCRAKSLIDFNALGAMAALGAASESLILSAHSKGFHVKLTSFPNKKMPELVASFEFFDKALDDCEAHTFDKLVEYIPLRKCNRHKSTYPVDIDKVEMIKQFSSSNMDFKVFILREKGKIEHLSKIIGAIDKCRFLDEAYHTAIVKEIRWSHEEAQKQRDGIDIELLGLKQSEKAGFQLVKEWSLMKMLSALNGGSLFEKLTKDLMDSDNAIALIVTDEITPLAYFKGGRFMQRLWLYCTRLGIDWHPMAGLVYNYLWMEQGKGIDMPKSMYDELYKTYGDYSTIFPISRNQGGIMLTRLVNATDLPIKSFRRDINDILIFDR